MIVFRPGRSTGIEALAFGPSGRTLVFPCGDRGLLVIDDPTAGGGERAFPGLDHDGWVYGPVRLSDDGRWASCRGQGPPLVFDTTTGEGVRIDRTRPHGTGYWYAATVATVAPDGTAVVCENISASNQVGSHQTQISCRPLPGVRLDDARWSVTVTNVVHYEPIIAGGEIITAEAWFNPTKRECELQFVARDPATGKQLRTSAPFDQGPRHPVASIDGRFVAALDLRTIKVWPSGAWDRPPLSVVNDTRKHFTGIAFHPSGRYLAATSNDTTVKLYDTQTWQVAKTFTWNIGRMRSVAFSPDGTLAAAGSDTGKVVVWDVDV